MPCFLLGQFPGALCLVNGGEGKTKASPYYSRVGVHLAGTLCTLKDLKLLPCAGISWQPQGLGALFTFHSGFVLGQEKAGLWAGSSHTTVDADEVMTSQVFTEHTWGPHIGFFIPVRYAQSYPGVSPYPSCSKSLWRVSITISSIISGFKISLIWCGRDAS